MVRQTQMNGRTIDERRPRKGLRRSISDLTNDVVALAELQWYLFVHDFRSSVRRTVRPLILAACGVLLSVCAVPIALLGAAYLLVDTGMPPAWSLLLTALVAAALGGLAAYLGSRVMGHTAENFDRSSRELRDNVAWLKRAVRHARNDKTRADIRGE